jgi:opacity protein-like surface antigen
MGDLIYHFDTGIPLGIYGGAGAGAVRTEVDDPISARNSTVFGWQALAGADYPVMPGVSIFAEYRYQNAHDANLKFLGGPVGNTSNNASAGLKFEF